MITTAAILAGGKGTRLGPLAEATPKPMLDICGTPLLERQIKVLKRYGVTRVFMLIQHRSRIIEDHFGDGSRFGMKIHHVVEDGPQGTGGALKGLAGHVDDDFFLIFGDVVFDMNLSRLAGFHAKKKVAATLVVHPTDHPHDSDLIRTDSLGIVRELLLKPHAEEPLCNLGNAGLYCLSPRIFDFIPDTPCDLMKEVLRDILNAGQSVAAYRTPEYLKDMGTPERLVRVANDMQSGRVADKNLDNPQSAVFIDRDGTLIELVDQLHKVEDLAPYPHAAEALRRLNESDFLSVLVTNQPVVARNLCSHEDVHDIHDRMEALLGRAGGWLDGLYFCPHHPDSGYPEENSDLKIACDCRKPGIGMFKQAASDLNIDLKTSWMVGDSTMDIQAGKNAGLRTILVKTGNGGADAKYDVTPDFMADNLARAVDIIKNNETDG